VSLNIGIQRNGQSYNFSARARHHQFLPKPLLSSLRRRCILFVVAAVHRYLEPLITIISLVVRCYMLHSW